MATDIRIAKNDFSDIELAVIPFNTLADAYGEELAREQLRLEHEAYELGEKRFIKMMERQVANGELADTAAAKPLVVSLLPKVIARINDWFAAVESKPGKRPVAYSKLQTIKPEAIAYITIKSVLGALTGNKMTTVQVVSNTVGKAIEEEARFGRIRDLEAGHFKKNVKEQLNKRVGTLYKRAFLNVIEEDMLSKGLMGGEAWCTWRKEEVIHVGVRCIEMLIESTGLVEVRRVNAGNVSEDCEVLDLTKEYVDIISTRAGSLAGISPMHQPCVVPPKPWTDITGGGYWANGRRPLPFIRTHGARALRAYEDVYMPEVYKAVNIAQNTAWKVNKKVLAVANEVVNWKNCPVEDIPSIEREEMPAKPEDIDTNEHARSIWKRAAAAIYRKDKARISRRLSLEFQLAQANKFAKYGAIWFPYNMDWRGRVYSVPMFNPQGNDMTKGLLTLAKGKPIGAEGFKWLKIHGANCASQKLEDGVKTDKADFDSRIAWVDAHSDDIMACAKNPIENTWWAEMDSPFCFLAFCFEYEGVMKHGLSYVSSLPIAFDGSCSGIQHFSAMLRDEVGGKAVNLLPSAKVEDIYGIVAAKVNERLSVDVINGTDNELITTVNKDTGEIIEKTKLGTKELAGQWLSYGVSRSVTKRSVMTLAYGSKEFGFRQQVLEDTIQPAIDNGTGIMFTQPNQAAGYMAKLIWESVSVTVVAAVEAMKWLQSAAKLLAAEVKDKKTGEVLRPSCAVHWVTPDGFPVWQEYRKPVQKRLNLMFMGSFRLQPTINVGEGSVIDKRKQESGIAPNYVHSMDGSHLRKTVVFAHEKYGVESFALIHDSFGTIPADAGKLFRAVRETMVETYENNDVLADFYEQFSEQLHESQLVDMPVMPARGNLDLQDILKSDFAFA